MLHDFTKDKFDIIILAGQSNAEGFSFGDVREPFQPEPRIYAMNIDVIEIASERVHGNLVQSGFIYSFAREYIRRGLLADDRKLLILRCAVGGTGFLGKHWGMQDVFYLRMMGMIRDALALNPENRLTALTWHQGEYDAVQGASYELHYRNLRGLFDSVRMAFGVPTLPIITADFVHHWADENSDLCKPVVHAIRDVCRDIGYCAFLETDGLTSNWQESHNEAYLGRDSIHFSRVACYELGKRYLDAYCTLTENI